MLRALHRFLKPLSRIQRALALLTLCSLASTPLSLIAKEASDRPVINTNPFVSEGYAQFEAGHPDMALEAFQKALKTNANDLSALLGQAMVYSEQQQYEDAFSSYDAIVRRYPRHAFAWNGRGLAAFNLEDFDEALSSFEKATEDQPVNGFFYESLAWTRMCRGEFKKAAESAKKATLMYNKKGESTTYPLLIAYFAYLESGDTENARRSLDYATRNKPVNQWPAPVIDYLNGSISAQEMISFVVNKAQETEAHTYIGLNLRMKGRAEEAERHLDWVSSHGDPRVFEYTLARAMNLSSNIAAVVR